MSDLPNKQFIEKLTCPIENIVNVLTLCKIIFSRHTSALFECSDRSNYYMCFVTTNQSIFL